MAEPSLVSRHQLPAGKLSRCRTDSDTPNLCNDDQQLLHRHRSSRTKPSTTKPPRSFVPAPILKAPRNPLPDFDDNRNKRHPFFEQSESTAKGQANTSESKSKPDGHAVAKEHVFITQFKMKALENQNNALQKRLEARDKLISVCENDSELTLEAMSIYKDITRQKDEKVELYKTLNGRLNKQLEKEHALLEASNQDVQIARQDATYHGSKLRRVLDELQIMEGGIEIVTWALGVDEAIRYLGASAVVAAPGR